MTKPSIKRIRVYQATAIFSMLLSICAFSYNVWRMEVTEKNNISREASFRLLERLSDLEQLVYAAHYDNNKVEGNPRNGWIMVGLINDLSYLTDMPVRDSAMALHQVWQDNWAAMSEEREATDRIVTAIDQVRINTRKTIVSLE